LRTAIASGDPIQALDAALYESCDALLSGLHVEVGAAPSAA